MLDSADFPLPITMPISDQPRLTGTAMHNVIKHFVEHQVPPCSDLGEKPRLVPALASVSRDNVSLVGFAAAQRDTEDEHTAAAVARGCKRDTPKVRPRQL